MGYVLRVKQVSSVSRNNPSEDYHIHPKHHIAHKAQRFQTDVALLAIIVFCINIYQVIVYMIIPEYE